MIFFLKTDLLLLYVVGYLYVECCVTKHSPKSPLWIFYRLISVVV